ERVVRDVESVDPDALLDPVDVRGGVEPRAETGLRESRGDERARRALAFRSGHVDGAEAPLRSSQALQQIGDRVEPAAHGGVAVAPLPVDEGVEAGEGVIESAMAHSGILPAPASVLGAG